MFLKNEPFEYNGQSVTLTELSALQRISHLAFLKAREEAEGGDYIQVALDDTIREGAYLVAMSLWHTHPVKGTLGSPEDEERQLMNEVLQRWPVEAISAAFSRVIVLSGMVTPVRTAPEEEETEAVTAGKPSTVN